jgi:phage protein D
MGLPVGPVIYAITVNGSPVKDIPLDVELRQCWGKHDLFFVRIEYPRTQTNIPTMKLWPDNAPVKIIWGRRPDNIQTWYGYVNHNNPKANADSGSKAFQITYVLTGISKQMNTDKNRTWGEVTPTYIARKIAGEYGLRCVVTKTDWVLPYEVQANESDFHFLNRMSDKTGYRFWVGNGTLYFINPAVVLQGSVHQSVPVFTLDKRFTALDTVREFNMNQGDNLPGAAKTLRSLYGIDITSGNAFQANASTDQSSEIAQIMSDWPAEDYNQAQRIVQAWQDRSQFWISANAELYGTSYLYPGKAIALKGAQLPQGGSGFWLVTSTEHILKNSGTIVTSSDKYVTRVELLRNESGTLPKIKSIDKITPEFMNCSLFNGKWRADSQVTIYDGVVTV